MDDVLGWKIEERLDFTHTTKSWKKMFEARKMLALDGKKRRTNVLGSLEVSLLKWFHVSLKLDGTFEERKTNYRLAFAHSLENPKWQYRENQLCIDHLKKFIEDSASFLDGVQVDQNTQMNESLHSVKGRTAPKITFWQSSWEARTAATILHFNEGPEWYIKCYSDIIKQPLLPVVESQLLALAQNKEKFYAQRKEEPYRKKEEQKRIEKRARHKLKKKSKKSEFNHK